MTEFNWEGAERHYRRWPHPCGISLMDLSSGSHQDNHATCYDAIWPALRSDIKRTFGHKDIDHLTRFFHSIYWFKSHGDYPYRWMFWEPPLDPPKKRDSEGSLKQLFWFPESFTWEDFVRYGDGVSCDSDEGVKRGARNLRRLRQLLACPEGQRLEEWDWGKAEKVTTDEVPF